MSAFKTIGEIDLGEIGRAAVRVSRYPQGGQLAISLIDAATAEPIATLSTNLAAYGRTTDTDAAGIKVWAENAPLVKPLLASGLFEDTGERARIDQLDVPIWRLANPEHLPPAPQRQHVR